MKRIPAGIDDHVRLECSPLVLRLVVYDRFMAEGAACDLAAKAPLDLAGAEELYRQLGAAIRTMRAQGWREAGPEGVKLRRAQLEGRRL